MSECPFRPKAYKNKASNLITFLFKRRSWLDGLYEKSYSMQMGRVKMPGFDLFVVNDPKEVKRIMVDEVREFPKSELLHRLLEPLLGNSIFTTNGEVWSKQRELLRPSFEMTRIHKVFELMKGACDDMMKRFENKEGEFINIDEDMSFVTADVIFRTIMSEKLDEQKGKQILQDFAIFQEKTIKIALQEMFCFPKWLSKLLGEKDRLRAGENIRAVLTDIIKPRYEEESKGLAGNKVDILASLLKVVDADTNERFSFKEILDQISMLFLAGHETTASSLTWSLYLLSLNPRWQDKVYEELKDVMQEEELKISHIKKFKLLNNVFKEALRLYPPVGFFPRTANKDTKIRDRLIKKDSGLVVAPWLIHRHLKFWQKPDEFDPLRFDEANTKGIYMPFGMGERVCIGQGFAMQEAMIVLSSILMKYKLKLKENFTPDVVGRLTVRSLNGMRISLIKR